MKFLKIACLLLAFIAVGVHAQAQGVAPASSYSTARSVDIMIRPVIPVLPTDICTASNTNCYTKAFSPPDSGAALPGSWCGNASSTTNSQSDWDVMRFYYVIPCQGHRIIYTATGYTTISVPAQPGYFYNDVYYDAAPAYDYQSPYNYKVNDCPIGYFTLQVSSEQNEVHHACIKS